MFIFMLQDFFLDAQMFFSPLISYQVEVDKGNLTMQLSKFGAAKPRGPSICKQMNQRVNEPTDQYKPICRGVAELPREKLPMCYRPTTGDSTLGVALRLPPYAPVLVGNPTTRAST